LIGLFRLKDGEQVLWSIAKPSSVSFAENVPAGMARQMSTLLVPVRSTASCELKTVIAICPIGVAEKRVRALQLRKV
jgi:hypothetical protein